MGGACSFSFLSGLAFTSASGFSAFAAFLGAAAFLVLGFSTSSFTAFVALAALGALALGAALGLAALAGFLAFALGFGYAFLGIRKLDRGHSHTLCLPFPCLLGCFGVYSGVESQFLLEISSAVPSIWIAYFLYSYDSNSFG